MKHRILLTTMRRRKGFTLVEMVVAASMTVAIVVAMSSYFGVIARMSTEKRGSQTLVTGLDAVREQLLTDIRRSESARVIRYDTYKQTYSSTPYNASPYFFTTVLYTETHVGGSISYSAYCVEPPEATSEELNKAYLGSNANIRGRLIKVTLDEKSYKDATDLPQPIRYVKDTGYPCAKVPFGSDTIYSGTRTYLTDETTQMGRLQAMEMVNSLSGVVGIRFSLYATYDLRVHDPSLPADLMQAPPRLTVSGEALTKQQL